jgi:adenosylcobyric acid synthase
MSARALMIIGTASHVGKSLVTAGLGRILSDEGIRVAPFKAQNMSLNSAATPDGCEIGRAQALQAEACRVIPCAEMNPVLIKPSSDIASQIVLLGRVWGQVTASDYHSRRVEDVYPVVLECYRTLAARYDVMLLEGAGSPAEINLAEHDIVNMRMAHAADAACLLVGDIDRGGVFASLLGTIELLEPRDRARIRAFLINKFRGDAELLGPGVQMIEKRLRLPCAGVVPFLPNLGLEEEDNVAMEQHGLAKRAWHNAENDSSPDRALRVGVVALPHIANFTDFDALAMEPSVSLIFLQTPEQARLADVIILPGSKQTIGDLTWMRAQGFAKTLAEYPGLLIGICGGFQMLGLSIEDPSGVENDGLSRSIAGLGQLSIRTILRSEKTVRRAAGTTCLWDAGYFTGYEIHMGETVYSNGAKPFAEMLRQGERERSLDGAIAPSERVWGTYIHGLFDDDAFRHGFLHFARQSCGLARTENHVLVAAERQTRIDRWANLLRQSLNMNLIRRLISST